MVQTQGYMYFGRRSSELQTHQSDLDVDQYILLWPNTCYGTRLRYSMSGAHLVAHLFLGYWVSRLFTFWGRGHGRKGLVNNSTVAWIHGCIPAISVDEVKNATLAYQISNSTNRKGIFRHDVVIL